MRPEPFLSRQVIANSSGAGSRAHSPDALAGVMQEIVRDVLGWPCQAAFVLHDVIDPATGEGLETLAMGATSAVSAPTPEHIDPASFGVLMTNISGATGTIARFSATRPFHRDQVIHLVYDLGDAVLGEAQVGILETRSITFLCNALRSFAIIDDMTERTWCAALDGLTRDDITLLQTLVSRRRFGMPDLAETLGLSQKDLKSQIRQIALRDIVSPNDTELLLHLIHKYGFLRNLMPYASKANLLRAQRSNPA